jgi:threonine dehydrogenase-like Zn-dependent dehydrogenase
MSTSRSPHSANGLTTPAGRPPVESLSVVLRAKHDVTVARIRVPEVGEPSVAVELGACGICGSDVRYYDGENPWALHTLGKNLPSPPNMVLGHEVAGTVREGGRSRRVAILAYRACGRCESCLTGNENRCDDMEHFGHSAGWGSMPYFPGGMAHHFRIWKGFDYSIPDTVSFEEATFLDGLAVAVHAVSQTGIGKRDRLGILGLGPIGLLAAQVARARGAADVVGCDVAELPVRLARETGVDGALRGDTAELARSLRSRGASARLDAVIDTVGTEASIRDGLSLLAKGGVLVLLAVHDKPVALAPIALSSERRLVTSSNNRYAEFPAAIELLGSGAVRVGHLITHRFPLTEAPRAFDLLLKSGREEAYKVVLLP